MPIKIIAELVALRIKYLKEISNEYLCLFRDNIPIRGNDVSSSATHAVIISVTDVSIIIPVREIINNVQNSERNFKVSLINSLPTVEIDNDNKRTTTFNNNEYLSTEIIFAIELLVTLSTLMIPENNKIVTINEANIPTEAISEDLNLLPKMRSDNKIINENISGWSSKLSLNFFTMVNLQL